MKKTIVYLNGGLGNQMFQYACGRALSLDYSSELVLDDWSGFVLDRQYKRHYELGGLKVNARTVTIPERAAIWVYKLYLRLFRPLKIPFIDNHWFGTYVTENVPSYLSQISELNFNDSFWLLGYWQSPKYFLRYSDVIRKELMPPAPPSESIFGELANTILGSDSVALGVRLYEESKKPEVHAKNGNMKTVSEINMAIDRLLSKKPSARFFVFCTCRSPILNQLNLPEDSIFVTHDDGYVGSLERLWLITKCRHHLFTNSSYYWWGAWLSMAVHENKKQYILAADNFINYDGICEEWGTF